MHAPARPSRPARALATALSLTFAALALPATARAAGPPTRVAVVDVRAVILALPVGTEVQTRLGELARERAHALDREKRALVERERAVEASKDPDTVREDKLQQIRDERHRLMMSAHTLSDDLKKEEERLLRPTFARIDAAVAAIADADGLTLVLKTPLSGVAYRAPGTDLTDITARVVARLKAEK